MAVIIASWTASAPWLPGRCSRGRETGHPLHEGADGGLVLFPGDQITFPVAWHCPILDLRWTLADVGHPRDPFASLSALAAGFAQRAPWLGAAGS